MALSERNDFPRAGTAEFIVPAATVTGIIDYPGIGTLTFRNTGVRMTQKTITRADLAEAVYGSVGLSRTESAELVERVLELIGDALVEGANVKLSSFGSFQVRSKNERIGRNPKTGEEVPILPRQVLVFKPSNVLKSKINKSMVSAGK